MGILINLQNINLNFGEKVIFNNASLTIGSEDRIGLIGLNGLGKSTLLKIIHQSIVPDSSTPPFVYDASKELNITYIPQEIHPKDFPSLVSENFYLAFDSNLYLLNQQLKEIEKLLGNQYHDEQLLHKHDELMQKINQAQGWAISHSYENYLKNYKFNFKRNMQQLSGGELKKLSLSAGLSSQSNLILWDEPTNHLDIESIERFEDDIQAQDRAFIMISHDRYLLSNICNKIIHIQNGKIDCFNGNYIQYLEYLEEKEAQRQKHLDKAQNKFRRELAWMRQGIKARGTRSKKRVEGFHKINTDISYLKSQTKRIVNLSLEHTGRKSKKLCQISNGRFSYEENLIFESIDLSIFKKDKIALVGHNGQGKTTLIKILTEDLLLLQGELFKADQLKVNVFSQNRTILDETKTPFELIGDGQDFVHLSDGRNLHINSYLENFLFDSHQVRRPIKTLSGGEKNRLQLAMFMKEASDLWIFDEPTNDLDIETIEVLEQILINYEDAVIIISHDRAFLDNVVNKSWVINNKKIETFEGGYTKIAPYLHALELEDELDAMDTRSHESSLSKTLQETKDDTQTERMSNKEKNRWKNIENEINQAEQKLDIYTSQLATFDFSEMDDTKNLQYEELHKLQKEWESKLESLYEEWEILSHKRP